MGMYDTVLVKCPRCGEMMEAQSKAGRCLLNVYSLDDIPEEIAKDLEGNWVRCDKCEISYRFKKEIMVKTILTIDGRD